MNRKIFMIFISFLPINAFALYNQNIHNSCGVVTGNMHAKYVINEYTCNAGYFLPANTEGCQPCPSGHTCNGGTFKFNPTQSQGIFYGRITQNLSKSCAANTATHMTARFTPNIINLNWYSVGDTVYETNTCTYGQPITLPATNPTRPGYIFSGWRLRTTPAQ